MNQRIHNLSKWQVISESEGIRFPGRPRTVVLDVNCPGERAFYIARHRDDIQEDVERISDKEAGRKRPDEIGPEDKGAVVIAFLGLARGRERFEFGVEGSFDLLVEGGDAFVHTFDGLDTATRIESPEIFTRVANRRKRNPELEMMQYQMRLNQERMMSELRHELDRRDRASNERYLPERPTVVPAPGAEPSADGSADAEGVAPADDGREPETAQASGGKARKKSEAPGGD